MHTSSLPEKSADSKIYYSNDSIVKVTFNLPSVLMFKTDVYFIKISPYAVDLSASDIDSKQLTVDFKGAREILDKLDQSKNGRQPNHIINFFVSGNFLMARTDPNTLAHYHLQAKSMHRPVFFMNHFLSEMQSQFPLGATFNMRSVLSKFTRSAISKGLFNLNQIPESLDDALSSFYKLIEEHSSTLEKSVEMKLKGTSTVAKTVIAYMPGIKDVKTSYADNITVFLYDQVETVLNELRQYGAGTQTFNIITLTVIELIKESNADYRDNATLLNSYLSKIDERSVYDYLSHPDIVALPASVMAAVNLNTLFATTLLVGEHYKEIAAKLRDYLKQKFKNVAFTENYLEEIKLIIEQDKRENGYLHRFYLEILRREDITKTTEHLCLESNLMRYTDRNIVIGDYTIPEKSNIVFLPGYPRFDERLFKDANEFNPDRYIDDKKNRLSKYSLSIFSETERRCPAAAITEYIAKTVISHLVLNYELTLSKENENDKWPTLMNITAIKSQHDAKSSLAATSSASSTTAATPSSYHTTTSNTALSTPFKKM